MPPTSPKKKKFIQPGKQFFLFWPNSNPTTHLHHKYVYLKHYASKQAQCCNLFDIHSHKKSNKVIVIIVRELFGYKLNTDFETVA